MGKSINITNQRFGRLVVARQTGQRDRGGRHLWLCRCDCGGTKLAASGDLRAGHTKSCGCAPCGRRPTHGMTNTPEYEVWRGMLQRCNRPNSINYHLYGGRGIAVCERWHKFENFYADVGPRPPGLTLDRINNNGNYEPGNTKWSTRKEQAANRRNPWLVPSNAMHNRRNPWITSPDIMYAAARRALITRRARRAADPKPKLVCGRGHER